MAKIVCEYNGTTQDLDDFCSGLRYQETINNKPNPETKTDFFKRKMNEYAKDVVVSFRANRDAETSRKNTLNANKNFSF